MVQFTDDNKTQQSSVVELLDTVCGFLLKLPFNVHKLFVKYIPFTISVITHADNKGKVSYQF